MPAIAVYMIFVIIYSFPTLIFILRKNKKFFWSVPIINLILSTLIYLSRDSSFTLCLIYVLSIIVGVITPLLIGLIYVFTITKKREIPLKEYQNKRI